jgi:hypothetical protein
VGVATARGLRGVLAADFESASLFDGNGYFRTTPGVLGTDGFFAAVIEKA